MKWLGRPSPFHLFTNPCVINLFFFLSRDGYLLFNGKNLNQMTKLTENLLFFFKKKPMGLPAPAQRLYTVSIKKKLFHFSLQSYGVFSWQNERLICPKFAFQ